MTRTSISLALVAVVSSVAAAQTTAPVPGWGAYAGCWQPVILEGVAAPATSPSVCVIPSGNGADMLSISNGAITDRTHIDADGAHHDVSRQGCSGWESAKWSADGRRLFLSTEQKCTTGITRRTSGLFAVTRTGDWMNIVNVMADDGKSLRVLRYVPAPIESTLPADVIASLNDVALANATARVSARSRATVDNVIEATKALNDGVVQAWLVEQSQEFDMNSRTLIKLSDAGVAPTVIDVMVAVSYPKVFTLNSNTAGVSTSETPRQVNANALQQRNCFSPMLDPWGYNDYNVCDPYRGYGYGFGYGRYPFGYGYDPYGYSLTGYRAGYGYGYGYYDQPVVVIVRGSAADPAAPKHGKMTRDGYTQGTTSTSTSSTTDRAPASSSSSSGSSSSGSSSSGSSSSGSSSSGSSGSSTARTAHVKPPGN